jgi:hypothetical protein
MGEAISSLSQGLAVCLFVHELVAEAAVLQVGVVHRLLDKHSEKQKYIRRNSDRKETTKTNNFAADTGIYH